MKYVAKPEMDITAHSPIEAIHTKVKESEDDYWSREAEKGEKSGYIGYEESRKLEKEIANAT